jgi:hypothetical protein
MFFHRCLGKAQINRVTVGLLNISRQGYTSNIITPNHITCPQMDTLTPIVGIFLHHTQH